MHDPKPRIKTTYAFRIFDRLTDSELYGLLLTAGVEPCVDRNLRLQQVLTVWFHGDIPSLDKFIELTNSEK
jgi:hypothetical protein